MEVETMAVPFGEDLVAEEPTEKPRLMDRLLAELPYWACTRVDLMRMAKEDALAHESASSIDHV